MFWRKKAVAVEGDKVGGEVPAAAPAAPDPARERARLEADLDASLEGSAGMLRALGNHAFSLGEEPVETISRTFERWATHVLVLGPVPGEVEAAPERPRREWAKLARFVEAHRKREAVWVTGSMRDMRETIFAMVSCFSVATTEQGRADVHLRKRLDRLRSSVKEGTLEELRKDALAAAEAVTAALEEQKRRSENQARELRTRLRALRTQLEDAQREGETDPLTKLQNRRVFDALLERSVLLSSVTDRPVSMVLVDLDHFKSINDRFGHPVGDKVLRELADCLTRTFPRRSDVVARIGGEEFGVLLSETGLKDARMLAERLRNGIRALRIETSDKLLTVTASIGVGESNPSETAADFVARVDQALYKAKNTGRDRVVDAAERPSGTFELDAPAAAPAARVPQSATAGGPAPAPPPSSPAVRRAPRTGT
jgi:diguanylate cyclase